MPKYSQNWNEEFRRNTAFLDKHSIKSALEIGSFEGLTSNYIVENLLTHDGTLICCDPLQDDYELDSSAKDNEIFRGQYAKFIENTEHNKDRIFLIRKKSEEIIHLLRENSIQFIYVDGHHRYNSVYFDGTEAFKLCAVNGYILFDDYLWNSATFEVKHAIDRVLEENPNYRLLLKLNQVLIQKLEPGSKTENGQSRYQAMSIEKLFNRETIYASYCNLDERVDRNEGMIKELARVDLEIPIVRTRSFPWKELYDSYDDAMKERVNVMFKRTPGAIGCHFSQVAIMEEALRQGRHAWVMEDDVRFCNDMPARLKIIFTYLNQHEWDILFFGGTYHIEPTWHKSVEGKHTHPDMQVCNCLLNRDWEETLHPAINRVYGAFSTHSYLVNKNRIQHVLNLLDTNLPLSMGIDWIMIKEQPNLNCYAFNPGCVIQYDNPSNIGDGISRFSGFRSLGNHWFSKSMDKYIPD